MREPFARLGAVRIEAPTWRRRRRSAIARRRPSILLRRRAGVASATPTHASRRARNHCAELSASCLVAPNDPTQNYAIARLEQFDESWRRAIGNTRPRRVARKSLRLQQRRVDQRQCDHVTRWNERLARLAELKADPAVHAGEGFHGFHRIGNKARIEIERGLRQHLLDQRASRQRRVAERQRIGQAIAQDANRRGWRADDRRPSAHTALVRRQRRSPRVFAAADNASG